MSTTRRTMLKATALSTLGMLGPKQLLSAAEPRNGACIFIWLNGGPSHFETFDPKPLASDDVRGPFGAIRTKIPGVAFSELVPMLAQQIDKFAVVRSLAHRNADHNSTAMLTGLEGSHTTIGAVVTKMLGPRGPMPPYVHIGSSKGDGTQFVSSIDGVGGGELGAACEPLRVRAPMGPQLRLGDLELREGVANERFTARRRLLDQFNSLEALRGGQAVRKLEDQQLQAAEMLTSTRVREAFDLTREPQALRERYGANFFGQSCLMARRLIEAGTRYVQIKWYDVVAIDAWDCHGADLPGMRRMEHQLCPRFDLGLSALFEDLDRSGLLETTLVVVVGEFGRTPTLNKNGDRDHWPFCFSGLIAGCGIPGGLIVGESDAKGAYPASTPISPSHFAATIYHRLGISTATDPRIRPFILDGVPIRELA